MAGTLYLVGTPIGNLEDLTPRAREILGRADLIAAEDTRRAGRLLARAGIAKRPMRSLFEGNERDRTEELVVRLEGGESVALISDAGMPTISDPGFRLVRACTERGIDVRVVPGPSAVTAALAVSGLPTDRFIFEGFLPRARGARAARIESFRAEPRTIVLFESPRRLRALLGELMETLGDRRVAVARELTKTHEEVLRGPISEVLPRLAEDPKGEVVVVVAGETTGATGDLNAGAEEAARLVGAGMRPREAARESARRHGLAANDVYRELLANPKNA